MTRFAVWMDFNEIVEMFVAEENPKTVRLIPANEIIEYENGLTLNPELTEYLSSMVSGYHLEMRTLPATRDLFEWFDWRNGEDSHYRQNRRKIVGSQQYPVIVFDEERDLVAWRLRP